MKVTSSQTERTYVFTAKELREKLGIEGEIIGMVLWKDSEAYDDVEWEISTEKINEGDLTPEPMEEEE